MFFDCSILDDEFIFDTITITGLKKQEFMNYDRCSAFLLLS